MPDGKVISGYTNVTEAIKGIIGIDRHQFSQIAMIAQGDFLRLLLANTDERGKILRKVFNTKIFQQFQDDLKKQAGVLRNQYEDLRKSILQLVKGIDCPDAHPAKPELEQLQEAGNIHALGNFLLCLENLIRDDRQAAKMVELQRLALQKEIDGLNQAVAVATADNSRLERFEQVRQKMGQLESRQKEYDAKRLRLQAAERALHKVKPVADAARLAADRADEYSRRIKAQQSKLEELRRQRVGLEAKLEAEKQRGPERESLARAIFILQNSLPEYELLDSYYQEIEQLNKDLEAKQKALASRRVRQGELSAAEKQLQVSLEGCQSVEVLAEKAEQELIHGSAVGND